MLVFGKIADSFGFKPQLLFGMALLGIASLITAFVPSALSMNILCGLVAAVALGFFLGFKVGHELT